MLKSVKTVSIISTLSTCVAYFVGQTASGSAEITRPHDIILLVNNGHDGRNLTILRIGPLPLIHHTKKGEGISWILW